MPLAAIVALEVLLALVGCTPSADRPSPEPSAQTGGVLPVTVDAVLSDTPFPSTCQHQAARLVNGARPWTDTTVGDAYVDPGSLVLGDLNGDGVDDGAVVATCTAGGVGWGAIVLVVTMSQDGRTELLGTVLTTDIKGPGIIAARPAVDSLQYDAGTLAVQVRTQMRDDAAAASSLPVDLRVVVRDGQVQIEDVRPRLDEGTAARALSEGTDEDPSGQPGELHAVLQQDVANADVASMIQAYIDTVVAPEVEGCYSSIAEVPWHGGQDALAVQGSNGYGRRFCLITSPASNDALVMALAQLSPEAWTVVEAVSGTV